MPKREVVLIAGVLAIGLFAVGCGGDDSSDASAERLTKAAFVKQANTICEKVSKKVLGAFAALFEQQSNRLERENRPDSNPVASKLIPGFRQEIDEISALAVPSGDEKQVDAFLDGLQELAHTTTPKGFGEDTDPYVEAEKPADAYGLTSCPMG